MPALSRNWILPCVVGALGVAIFFRTQLLSGFALGFGDRGDSIIALGIFEHWRNFWMGAEAWNQPGYFHPYANTLGYNDGYFLHGIFYSLWRIGFDAFTAETLVSISYKALGFAASYLLVARALGWQRSAALLIALLFTLSNNLFVRAGHSQVNSIVLLPVVAVFVVGAFQCEMAGRLRAARVRAVCAALAIGLWLWTSFYFAWFCLFFCLVFLCCWFAVEGRKRPILAELNRHRVTLALFAGTFAITCIPFLLVYLPKLAETGGQPYRVRYLTLPTDLINVGPGNLVWGWLTGGEGQDAEHQTGFPLVFFALACAAAWTQVRRRDPLLFAFALAILISWFLTIRFGKISGWAAVHALVPGASGMRVVLRYQLFLVLPLLLLIGATYRDRFGELLRSKPVLAAGLVALLVAEQINLHGQTQFKRHEVAELDAIPAPPAKCRSFFTVATRRAEPLFLSQEMHDLYPHNVDAMYLAGRWHVPTINGFSTFNPPGWDFARPLAADYETRVAAYARARGLQDNCRLDVRRPQPWRLAP